MSRSGQQYRAANGAAIRNLGQAVVRFRDDMGRPCALPAQIAEVEKPLISVRALAEAGNVVTMRADGGEVRHLQSGRTLPLKKVGKVYYLGLTLENEEGAEATPPAAAAADFARQGQ